ncbi:MAG: metallophosphoesterase family protein [Candidatus Syntropharchaeia archaeon]
MLKILLIADVHGEVAKLSEFLTHFKEKDFDLVLCPGDFTDMFNVPEGYSQMDIAEIVLQKLLSLGKPVFCVPGNHDPYEILDLFDEYEVNLHARSEKFRGFRLIGFGGALTPFNTKFEPTEEEMRESLSKLAGKRREKTILLTHSPPYGTVLDKTENGKHVGSKAVREFIEKEKPVLAISAHIHEAGGVDRIGNTTAFYPGPLFEGSYGMVKIEREVRCETKKF